MSAAEGSELPDDGAPVGLGATPEEIRTCAGLLAETMSQLEAQAARGGPRERVDFAEVHAQLGVAAAALCGDASDAARLGSLVSALARGDVSETPEPVECRTPGCDLARVPVLEHAGTACPGCGRALCRLLGPVGAQDCPGWCQGHPVQDAERLVHERSLVNEPGLRVDLEETWEQDPAGEVMVDGPWLLMIGAEEQTRLAVDGDTLGALQRAVVMVGGLLDGTRMTSSG